MSTSATCLSSDPNKICNNSFHWRNNSGELDVFEAARYFSTAADQAVIREDRLRAARRSLDVPIMLRSNPTPPVYHHTMDQKQQIKDQNKKQLKLPTSPGGRLASFLNSLFNQTSLKKKSKSGAAAAKEYEDESPGGRRKRRSSISHFRITTTAAVTKNAVVAAADKGSGFRTPPPYAITPTKSYKELSRVSDHPAVPLPLDGAVPKPSSVCAEKNKADSDERNMFENLRKWSEEDDGGESDSSSDLFDLPNLDLDLLSSSLPVYETTHMERIRIGTPISSAM